MKKKGSMSAKMFVTAALAIVGFIIMMFFLFNIGIDDLAEDQVCKLSVLTRATTQSIVGRIAPLKCTTKKICLTLGNTCPQFLGEDFTTIKLSKSNPQKAADKIEEVTARTKYSCWKMMGEGKLDVFGQTSIINSFNDIFSVGKQTANFLGLQEAKPMCIICSRVALSTDFDNNAHGEILSLVNVNDYMKNTQVPGESITYLQAFTDRQVNTYPSNLTTEFQDPNNYKPITNQIANLFIQIKTDQDPSEAASSGAIGAGAFILGGAYGVGATGTVLIASKIPVIGAIATIGAVAGTAGLKYYTASRDQDISVAFCGQFTSAAEKQQNGCSIITQADYNDIETINKLCAGGIDGNP